MTGKAILEEIEEIKKYRKELAKFYNRLDENREEACNLLNTNPTDLNEVFLGTVAILGKLELFFKNKIESVEVDISYER